MSGSNVSFFCSLQQCSAWTDTWPWLCLFACPVCFKAFDDDGDGKLSKKVRAIQWKPRLCSDPTNCRCSQELLGMVESLWTIGSIHAALSDEPLEVGKEHGACPWVLSLCVCVFHLTRHGLLCGCVEAFARVVETVFQNHDADKVRHRQLLAACWLAVRVRSRASRHIQSLLSLRTQDGLITYEEFLTWMAKNPIALGFFTKIREVSALVALRFSWFQCPDGLVLASHSSRAFIWASSPWMPWRNAASSSLSSRRKVPCAADFKPYAAHSTPAGLVGRLQRI